MRDAALSEVVMTDVAPYSLGVELSVRVDESAWSHGHFDPIIERNTVVPVSRMKTYFPAGAKADHVSLQVYQGEARMARDNIALGSLKVPLPQGAEQDRGIDVRFTYDVNGLLQVEAKVPKTGQVYGIVIEGNPGVLSEQEIQERLKSLAQLKIHPREQLENRTLLARAERCYEQLRGDERERLGRQILQFEQLLATQDSRRIAPGQKMLREILDQLDKMAFLDSGPRP
jgi:molecular chaperone HscC